MPKTAIVIDDDTDTVRIFSEFLEENEIRVLGNGYSGKDAVEIYKKVKPDMVFVDIMMPDGSGFYAIRKIRELDPDSKIIAVTADSRSATEEKLVKLNTTAIIYKPFEVDKIIQLVNKSFLN